MFNIKINCSILRKYENKKLKQATSLIRVEKKCPFRVFLQNNNLLIQGA
jgi:hypothetical protein